MLSAAHQTRGAVRSQARVPFSSAHKSPSIGRVRRVAARDTLVVTCANGEKLTVAITGATGFVGSRLTAKLLSQGHKVRVLTRNKQGAKGQLPYPGLEFFGSDEWANGVQGATAVVNLAGEPIGTRWTPEIKREIKASRLNATNAVVAAISAAPEGQRPKVLVSASAVGFYGSSQSATFSEDSESGRDYLAQVCREWEAAANRVPGGVRVCILRVGIVLGRDGGVLAKMLPVFQLFAGGPLGSGRQWMSWIHRDDLTDMMLEAINNPDYSGAYNATAPTPVRMSDLCNALGSALGRPNWLPVPDFAIQTLMGEGAMVVLEGQRVLPTRTQSQGFRYKYSEVADALRNILR